MSRAPSRPRQRPYGREDDEVDMDDTARAGEAGRAERAAKNVAIIRASGKPAGPLLKATLMVATCSVHTM